MKFICKVTKPWWNDRLLLVFFRDYTPKNHPNIWVVKQRAENETRTRDLRITNASLYQLSYSGFYTSPCGDCGAKLVCFCGISKCFYWKSQKRSLESYSVDSIPTCCFDESDVLFCWKWRVVLMKVTCCFDESDVLFWWKRRVVLLKVTCRFWWTIRSGICPIGKRESVRMNQSSEVGIFICENTYNRPSRAHAYAHITGVLLFLLSQVSHGCW